MKQVTLLAIALWLLAAYAFPAVQPQRVGILLAGAPTTAAPLLAAFREGLREHGFAESDAFRRAGAWEDLVGVPPRPYAARAALP